MEARNKCISVLVVHAGMEADPIDALVGNISQLVSCQTLNLAMKPCERKPEGKVLPLDTLLNIFLDVLWL